MNWRPFSINDALADPGRGQDRFRQANAAEATQDDANALQARLQQAIDRLRQNGKR